MGFSLQCTVQYYTNSEWWGIEETITTVTMSHPAVFCFKRTILDSESATLTKKRTYDDKLIKNENSIISFIALE
jgi:hypothetical protein